MSADMAKRLGGFWFSPVPMLERERLLRAELGAMRRPPMNIYLAAGRTYLTNCRLIWSPLFVYSLVRLIRNPVVISLSSVEGCTLGSRDWFSPLVPPMDVQTDREAYRFYMGASWGKRVAVVWMGAIASAVQAARDDRDG